MSVCEPCKEAADKGKPKLHRQCKGCTCQHRPPGSWKGKR